MKLIRVGLSLVVLIFFAVRSLAGVTDSVGLEWVRQYGSRNIESIASDLAVDSSGNIYVLGTGVQPSGTGNFLTVKYRPDGSEVWAVESSYPEADLTATGLAVDKTSGVIITGKSYNVPAPPFTGLVTVKLDSLGNEVWRAVYDNPRYEYESSIGVGLDSIGNAYVVGRDWISDDQGANFLVVKYSSDGQQLWVSNWGFWIDSEEYPYDFAVDRSGKTYVTGVQSLPDRAFYGTAVFLWDGAVLWGGGDDAGDHGTAAHGVAYDNAGNSYVTGVSDYASFYGRCVTIKYDQTGQEVWERIYESDPLAAGSRVSVTAGGDVYVAASSAGDLTFSTDIILIKYNTGGGPQQWVARYDGSVEDEDPVTLAIDEDSNIYVTGYSPPSTTLLKYSAEGALLWTQTYHDTLETDVPVDMVVDGKNVYVLATSSSEGGASYLTLLKYSPISTSALSVESRVTPRSGDESLELGFRVTNDSDEDVTADIWVDLVNPNGSSKEILLKPSNEIPAGRSFNETKLIELKEGSIPGEYSFIVNVGTHPDEVLASTTAVYTKRDSGATAGVQKSAESMERLTREIPIDYSLAQNYPNPFNPSARIDFALPVESHVKLMVYDILGSEVVTLLNKNLPAGYSSIEWNGNDSSGKKVGSGVYIYRMTAIDGEGHARFESLRKMILLK